MHEQTNPEPAPRPSTNAASDRATLFLRGIGSPVNADVYHRSASRLTVRRELQFLRVGSEVVDDDGRQANIASVRVYVENDVPTLIMELRYPSDGGRRGVGDRDPGTGARTSGTRDEATVVFGTEPDAYPRIVSTPTTFVDELVSTLRRLVGTILRVSRWARTALAKDAYAGAITSGSGSH